MAKVGDAILKGVVTGVVIELTRQVGQGVREYLRDLRKNANGIKVVPIQPPAQLRGALKGLGYGEREVLRAIQSKEVREVETQPLDIQVRAALKVLTP